MSDLGNRLVMAENLKYYLKLNNKTRKQLCADLKFPYSTFNEWANAKAYPRIDKIEIMSNYFNIEKSDLIERKEFNDLHKKQLDAIELGARIKMLRLDKKMTLEQLGEYVGVSKSTVRKWETGMIANMRQDKIPKLAKALDTTPAYLMGWEEEQDTENDIIKSLDNPIFNEPIEIINDTKTQNNKRVEHYKKWVEVFGDENFSDEEFEEVINFAKFVLSKRKKE